MRRLLVRLRATRFGGQARLRAARLGGQVLVCAVVSCAACSEPPQKEIDRAQGAIDAARAAGADQYATGAFSAATAALHQAHDAVEQRDYRLALSRAMDANERALEAAKEAANGKARARSEAEGLLTMTAAAVQQLETKLRAADAARLPAAQLQRSRRLRVDAQRALQEARAAVKEGDYLAANSRIKPMPTKIAEEIKAIDEAMVARTRRRR